MAGIEGAERLYATCSASIAVLCQPGIIAFHGVIHLSEKAPVAAVGAVMIPDTSGQGADELNLGIGRSVRSQLVRHESILTLMVSKKTERRFGYFRSESEEDFRAHGPCTFEPTTGVGAAFLEYRHTRTTNLNAVEERADGIVVRILQPFRGGGEFCTPESPFRQDCILRCSRDSPTFCQINLPQPVQNSGCHEGFPYAVWG